MRDDGRRSTLTLFIRPRCAGAPPPLSDHRSEEEGGESPQRPPQSQERRQSLSLSLAGTLRRRLSQRTQAPPPPQQQQQQQQQRQQQPSSPPGRAVWRNGELWTSNTEYQTFVFKNDGLANFLGCKGEVTMADLSRYVYNGCATNIPDLTLYWRTHSSLIYILSNITHCYSLIVSSGSINDSTMCDRPRMYLKDAVAMSPLTWPDSIEIVKVQRTADAEYVGHVYAESFVAHPSENMSSRLEAMLATCFNVLAYPSKFPKNNPDFDFFARSALTKRGAATFFPCSDIQHQFLCHVGLLELGERNDAHMILNAMYVEVMWAPNPIMDGFSIYGIFKRNVVTACRLLNSIRDQYERLPLPSLSSSSSSSPSPADGRDDGDGREDEDDDDGAVICLHTYFGEETLDPRVVFHGTHVLKNIGRTNCGELTSRLEKHIDVSKSSVTVGQLKNLLQIYY
ncbi:protein U59 [Proboscivirus elephantidbeta4]|uniref:Protein U59 n=1 Tax=Elephant endotheliotropic herpesvirus 4 TaxID=548914 RepID=A0A0S1TPH3_9BETA|nr:protein U59 [Elephant endotheliotropic herpesvirus 4]ALM26009.1 protein U59 [Elephant endotheliotropic herpesvirus 4]